MKHMKKYLTAMAVSLLVCSCSFLDTAPEDFVSPEEYYNTAGQLESALLGVYAVMSTSPLYCNNMLGRMGLDADLGYEHYNTDKSGVGYYDASPSDVKVTNYWKNLYNGIDRANLLLDNLDRPEMDETRRAQIRAEALFLRAYYHFMLVVRYGDIPLKLTPTRSAEKKDLQVPQSSRREVYLKIISDIEEAAPNLPDAADVVYGERASKSAAYGILARVCLNMAGYPLYEDGMYAKAKAAAETVISYGFHELNPSYQDVFIKLIQDEYDIKESIFEVGFWGTDTGTYTTVAGMVGRNNGIYFNNSTYSEVGISIGCLRANEYYYNLFEPGDLRRDWTIADFKYENDGTVSATVPEVWERCCGKFRRTYELNTPKAKDKTSTNFPILRYSDVLLMYAEAVAADDANNNASELAKAYEYVNQVRRRGFGLDIYTPSPIDASNDGKGALLDLVKDERARELGYELTRKDDIVRWGEFYRRMQYVKGTVPAGTTSYLESAAEYYGGVQSRDFVWPIPSYEIGVNRTLVQNQGW